MSALYSAAELVRVLRSTLPVAVTLPDPVTGEPFSIVRDDVLGQLVVDVPNLEQEAQLVAAQYALFGRARRAAELAAERADSIYAKWKAGKAAAFRAGSKDKKATIAETEEAYRTDPDYEVLAVEGARLRAIAGLMEDVQRAFSIKAQVIRDLMGSDRVSRSVHRTEDRGFESASSVFVPPPNPPAAPVQPPKPFVPPK